MEPKTRQYLFVTAFGVGLFAALWHFSAVLNALRGVVDLLLPILVGGILAAFLNVLVSGLDRRLARWTRSWKKPLSPRLRLVVSFLAALVCILFVFVLTLTLLVPELARSFQSLYAQVEAHIPQWLAYLDRHDIRIDWLEDWLSTLSVENLVRSITGGMDKLLTNVAGAVSSTVNVVTTAGFALIICAYIILDKERLCRHSKLLLRAYCKPRWAAGILRFCRMFSESFAKFLSGQCAEAVILGFLMCLAFGVCRLPYGLLVGLLTAVCAIIPYVGAFLSCVISVLLTALVAPALALRCLVVYLVVQFVENQFIYPRVVGSSVGLTPFYTLLAAMLGGKLFGVIGIIFFIPLTAVVLELIRENAEQRIAKQ